MNVNDSGTRNMVIKKKLKVDYYEVERRVVKEFNY